MTICAKVKASNENLVVIVLQYQRGTDKKNGAVWLRIAHNQKNLQRYIHATICETISPFENYSEDVCKSY